MKQVFQNPKSGKTNVEDVAAPSVSHGRVLVRNHYSVISAGTERSIIELSKKSALEKAKERPDYVQKFFRTVQTKGIFAAWQMVQAKLSVPIALGYSSAGEVLEAGSGVEMIKPGDRVACAGQDHASHAEIVSVPKNLVAKIPEGVADDEAAFTTLGAIALQGIRQAELTPGENVAVVGLGLLGQIGVRMLKSYGHPVLGIDVNPAQVAFAEKNGLNQGCVLGQDDPVAVSQRFTDGRGVDAVIIYASSKSDEPLKLAVSISREKGRVVQVGSVLANIPWRDFYQKELAFFSSRSYGPGRYDRRYEEGGEDYPVGYVRWTEQRNMEEFLRLLAEKRVNVRDLVTKTFPIAEAEAGYRFIFESQQLVHGVLLSYPEGRLAETTLRITEPVQGALVPQQSVRVGIVGVGAFMTGTVVPLLKKMKDVSVRAVCDSRGLIAKNFATALGAEYTTSDYHKVLEDRAVDLIVCATRHSSHAAIAEAALAAGKSIYVEKPLALNSEELENVLQVAASSKGRLLVGFNRRFSLHVRKTREAFLKRTTPVQMLYRVNAGPLDKDFWGYDPKEGGRILGEGCHFVDTLQYIVGAPAVRVSATAVPVQGAVTHEENFTVTIEYADGSQGTIVYTALGNFRAPKEYFEVYGGGTVCKVDDFKTGSIMRPSGTEKLNLWKQDKGYAAELSAFLDALRSGARSPMPLEDIRTVHETTFAILESLRTGKPVTVHGRAA